MFLRSCIMLIVLFFISCADHGRLSGLDIKSRAEYYKGVEQFIEEMNAKHGFDKAYLKQLFDSVAPINVARSISQSDAVSLEPPNWKTYRDKMINAFRTQQGVLYYNENREALLRAERDYGIPPHIIVGIIGIETNYGRIRMPYKAIDALATLSFISTRRGDYFKSELESFLLLTQKKEIEPTSLMGSYAGAIGIPQFMPSNVKRFGIDGDDDGIVDIVNSHADAILSIGNYLLQYGWQRNEPVSLKVNFKGKVSMVDNYLNSSACSGSKVTLRSLETAGFIIPAINSDKNTAVRLIKLYVGNDNYEYHIAFDNLCVLMKYNQSLRYAMAVNYLGVSVANKGNLPIHTRQEIVNNDTQKKAKKITKKNVTNKARAKGNKGKK